MAFRDPAWDDDVYVFGYPRVPMIAGMAIAVQRGEVVNPAAETPAGGGPPRQKTFLYSAIARPGNSGGPIVAHDGRVIGLVVEDCSPTARAQAADYEAAPAEHARGADRASRGRGQGIESQGHHPVVLSRHPIERSHQGTRRPRLR
jgi:S1-C subfamily serine protease|nr:serine protease [Mycobacterium intracellulare]